MYIDVVKPAFLSVKEALMQGTQLLADASVSAPRLTAEVLLAHAAGQPKEWLYAHSSDPLLEVWWIHFGRYLHERMRGKPLQYITGVQEFYGRAFRVTPDVLIPRPETEHLIEAVLKRYSRGAIADVGTGSGAIAVTLALELKDRVFGVDVSGAALRIAACNARTLGAEVAFVQASLLTPFKDNSLAMVASNPPYVPETDRDSLQPEVRDFEPHLALFGGTDGLQHIRCIIEDSRRVLKPGGWLVMEMAFDASPAVSALMLDWQDVELTHDLAGYPRVIAARLP